MTPASIFLADGSGRWNEWRPAALSFESRSAAQMVHRPEGAAHFLHASVGSTMCLARRPRSLGRVVSDTR